MTNSLSIMDYIVIALILSISALIGLYFRFSGGRQKTTSEFLMGGKSMGIGPVAFSLMASYVSAINLLGVPSETYMYGTQLMMWLVGMPLGAFLVNYAFLPIFFDMDAVTSYEYLERRFGSSMRTVAALSFAVQMILAMSVVLYTPSLALSAVTGLSTWTSVISLAVVCTFYCSMGGLKAVLWTDVFQAIIMYVAIISVTIKACMLVGFNDVFNIANEGGRLMFFNTSTDLTARYTLWNAFLTGVVFCVQAFGTSQVSIQRMMSIGDLNRAQSAVWWSIPLIAAFNVFIVVDGIAIYSMFHDCDPMNDPSTKLSSPDQLMPLAIIKLFHDIPGLPGLCISGVLSACLSTVSSAVNSLTAVTMEDFIRPHCLCKGLTEIWMTFIAKMLAVLYGVITLLLTILVAQFRGIVEAATIMYSLTGGPILGVFVLGMFTKTANEKGTLFGLMVGFAFTGWMGFGSYLVKAPVETLSRSTNGCLVAPNATFQDQSRSFENLSSDEDRYIFPLYRVAFLWLPVFGTLVAIIVGYFASLFLSICFKQNDVKPEFTSPFVRKLLFKSTKDVEITKM